MRDAIRTRDVDYAIRMMHVDLWKALRRVEREGCAGSPEARDGLFDRNLAEWVPGQFGLRLTMRGRAALQWRDRSTR